MSGLSATEGGARLREARTWLMPTAIIVAVAAALPAIYLAASSDPQGNLDGLKVAIVIEGAPAANAPSRAVAAALRAIDQRQFDFVSMTGTEADAAIAADRLAGSVVIPADFDATLASLSPGSPAPTIATVSILTNAGDGGLASGLVINGITPMLRAVSGELGIQLLANAGTVPPANAALLAEPFRVAAAPHTALPSHSGLGTSAFYFALVLVLIAFIGASLIGPIVDGALGFHPAELGPLVSRRSFADASRLRTFVTKAGILVTASPVAAGAALAVAYGIGIRPSSVGALWVFSTLAIAAIGTSALAVFAALGGLGSIVNTLFFVALALASSGGITPLAATPPIFSTISVIAPFHYVVNGVRSFLYFDGSGAAGLTQAWVALAIGGTVGVIAGVAVTALYGRVPAFSRNPSA